MTKPLILDGVYYPSRAAAAEARGVSRPAISQMLRRSHRADGSGSLKPFGVELDEDPETMTPEELRDLLGN